MNCSSIYTTPANHLQDLFAGGFDTFASLLDLMKAFDCVSQDILSKLILITLIPQV